MRSPFIGLVFLLGLGCGSHASSRVADPLPEAAPETAEPAPDMTQYWANVALIDSRYCGLIAELSTRVLDACGCTPEQRQSMFTTADELRASCTYHLISQIPETQPMMVDETALRACSSALDAALTGCTSSRLPRECELSRIFTPPPAELVYARPAGTDCRAENGDEGFDAHFLCAPGLWCDGTCTSTEPTFASPMECANPLAIAPAIP